MSNMHVQRIVNAALVASLTVTGSSLTLPTALADNLTGTGISENPSKRALIADSIPQLKRVIDPQVQTIGTNDLKNDALKSNTEDTNTSGVVVENNTNTPGTVIDNNTNDPRKVEPSGIAVESEKCIYNGKAQEPKVTVKDDQGIAVDPTEYKVTYSENINAGTTAQAIVTFNDSTKYSVPSISVSFTIQQCPVVVTADDQIIIEGTSEPELTATVTIAGSSDPVSQDIVKYTCDREKGENPGTYIITPKGEQSQGNYMVSFVTGKFTIISAEVTPIKTIDDLTTAFSTQTVSSILLIRDITADVQDLVLNNHDVKIDLGRHTLDLGTNSSLVINGGDVTLSNGKVTTGSTSVVTSAIKLTDGTLKLNTNVTIESPSSAVTASGTSKVTIDGATITAGSTTNAALDADDSSTIDAENLTLTVAGDNLAVSKDTGATVNLKTGTYHVLHKEAIEPYLPDGYALAYITSLGAYSPRKNLADDDHTKVTVTPDTYEYEGTEVVPTTVTVTFDDVTLSSSDYDVTYDNNDEVGTATVTVTAKNESDYTGSKSTTFEIESGAVEVEDSDVTLSQTSFTYNGKEQAPTVKVTVNGETVSSKHYDIEYSDNTDAGTAKVEVTFDGEEYEGDITKEFTIDQKEVTVTPANKTKTAGDSDPTFTATVSGTLGSDTVKYKLTRDSGESAGTYTIKASGDASQGNYKVTYKTGTLTIKAKSTSSSSSSSSSPSSTKSTTTTSTKTTTSSNNSGTSSKSNTDSSSSSSSNKNSSSTGSSIGASSANSTSSKSNSTAGTGSSSATTNKTPTAATGAADTSTSAAATTTKQPTARTADPSFTGFGALVTGALAALGIGLRTKRRNNE